MDGGNMSGECRCNRSSEWMANFKRIEECLDLIDEQLKTAIEIEVLWDCCSKLTIQACLLRVLLRNIKETK